MGRKFFVGGYWKCTGMPDDVIEMFSILKDASVPSSDVVEVVVGARFLEMALRDEVRGQLSQLCADFQFASTDCWVLNPKRIECAGEISPKGCVMWDIPWIITGHYDGRILLKQPKELIGDKVAHALSTGLKVIACVGETLVQRMAGETMGVVAAQTKAISDKISDWSNVVIAYQPAWTIGTSETATADQAQEVHAALRSFLSNSISTEVAESTRIIYGGPVEGNNCEKYAAQPDIDGFLVGGAYLKPEFIEIINAATLKTA